MPWFTKKKKKKNASFTFSGHIQDRFQPFPASFGRFQPVSAVSTAGRYDPIWPIRPDFGQISPVRRESKPHWRESSRVSANPRRKKKRRHKPTRKQPRRTPRPALCHVERRVLRCATSDAGVAPLVPRPCFLGVYYHDSNSFLSLSSLSPKKKKVLHV